MYKYHGDKGGGGGVVKVQDPGNDAFIHEHNQREGPDPALVILCCPGCYGELGDQIQQLGVVRRPLLLHPLMKEENKCQMDEIHKL